MLCVSFDRHAFILLKWLTITFQAEYDDYKEESSKMQQQQLNEINDLQSKLKEIQGQLKQAISEKDNALEHLKVSI